MAEDSNSTQDVKIEHQLSDLKGDLLDLRLEMLGYRESKINWQATILGIAFAAVIAVVGVLGFSRFKLIENEAQRNLDETRIILEHIRQKEVTSTQIVQDIQRMRALLYSDSETPQEPDQEPEQQAVDAPSEPPQEPAQEPEQQAVDAPSEPPQEPAQELQQQAVDASLDAEAFYRRGAAKRKQGLLSEAIADYSRAIELRENYPEAYNNRGVAKEKQGLHAEAIEDYDRAIELRQNYPEAYNNRGNVKQFLGLLSEAIPDYGRAISLRPNYSNAYNNRAIAKERLGLILEALDDYGKAIDLQSNFPAAYYNRGKLRIASGFMPLGQKDLERAFQLAQQAENPILLLRVTEALAKLTSITLPTNLTTIEENAFHSSLMETITFPTGVTTIGENAFHSNRLGTVVNPNR